MSDYDDDDGLESTPHGFKQVVNRVKARLDNALRCVELVVNTFPDELENSFVLNKYDSRSSSDRDRTKKQNISYFDELKYICDVLQEWIVEIGVSEDEPAIKEWKLRQLTNGLSWASRAKDQAQYIEWDTKERLL